MIVVEISSIWFIAGFEDQAFVACGTFDFYIEPWRERSFEVWRVNDLCPMANRLRNAVSFPTVERTSTGGWFVSIPLWPALLVLAFMTWAGLAATADHRPGRLSAVRVLAARTDECAVSGVRAGPAAAGRTTSGPIVTRYIVDRDQSRHGVAIEFGQSLSP